MPDHIHMLVIPRARQSRLTGSEVQGWPAALSSFVGDWASVSAHLVNRSLRRTGALWQEGFYDHRVRHTERLDLLVQYIHDNPVRQGLAQVAEGWPWSSANTRFVSETDWDFVRGNRLGDEAPTSAVPALRAGDPNRSVGQG